MLVSEIINLLVASELKPLSLSNIGGDLRDEQQEDNFRQIVSMINMAYSELYEKFALLQKEYILKGIENNKTYILPGDFIYPVQAELRDGTPVSVNNERRVDIDGNDINLSLMFPEPFLCLVKGNDPNNQTDVSLVYCADPEPISKPHDNVNITRVFLPALMSYVAYRAFLGIDGHMESTNNTYLMRYVSECQKLRTDGLTISDNLNSNVKLEERGWV